MAMGPRIRLFLTTAFLLSAFALSAPPASADWKEEWSRTVAEAEREGGLIVYAGSPFSTYQSLLDEFKKRYPKITASFVAGRGAQIGPRIIFERRAEKYSGDLFVGGKGTAYATLYAGKALDPIQPLLLLPEVLDESKWWQGKHKYLEPEGRYIFVFVGNTGSSSITYNTKLVQPREISAYRDLLNLKWKGKIAAYDPRARGQDTLLLFFYHHPELGPGFIRKLYGEMGITFSRDPRQPIDWLARGKFAICVPCADVQDAMDQGLPIAQASNLKEGSAISSNGHTISVLNRAPHPQATKLFVNWLLSREGQIVLQRVKEPPLPSRPNSLRIDIPKDDVPPEHQRAEGKFYFDGDDPRYSDRRPVDKLLNEILGGK